MMIEFVVANVDTFGSALLQATGSRDFYITLCAIAKKNRNVVVTMTDDVRRLLHGLIRWHEERS